MVRQENSKLAENPQSCGWMISRPLRMSHSRAVPSLAAVTTMRPFWFASAELMLLSWPRVPRSTARGPRWPRSTTPVPMSHRRTLPSPAPVITDCSSGVNATSPTLASWPWRTATVVPRAASHTRAVSSAPPVTTSVPPALKAALSTEAPWPTSWAVRSPVRVSQTAAGPSVVVVTMELASGLNAACNAIPFSSLTARPLLNAVTRTVPPKSRVRASRPSALISAENRLRS